ncbi:hypothetical protein [Shewanella fidelis]|uniref:Uncharacterized protein n=1 Tax=Shewanella fidelis TaxID=173509 RepID=A0AAW8NMC7_9GAMM|nr:hypothetical protein [Shewanella fidelis]MDR8523455.1 hypothetical protein [Shewanella fidelis]MDW4813312.1 hypothetical protein [Shewanella fidelis]MDW4817317.1 hypothetical protein [Shewanella fidelis]MDW4821327.1 hypothetical protein [Shewanella fidelis]MDW4824595.1 hypothetical protein [Shewanella fidelis]
MLLLLLLPILVSGYIVFTTHPFHYYRLHRYEGQLLYLGSAYYGVICTALGITFTLLVNCYVPPYIEIFTLRIPLDIFSYVSQMVDPLLTFERQEKAHEHLTWMLLCSIASLLVAKLWAYLATIRLWIKSVDLPDSFSIRRLKISIKKRKWLSPKKNSSLATSDKAKILLMSSILKDSPMDALFLESYINEEFLLITLSDRKVYVGRVISLGEPNESEGMDQEITITPFLSGYRDKDALFITYTTKYNEVSEDVALTLKQDLVTSATKFSVPVYEEFKLQKPKEKEGLKKVLKAAVGAL